MVNYKKGLVSQLHSMLTNHPDRMHSMLEVRLVNRKTDELIDSDRFEIYTNHPVKKIEDKVEKLRTKGDIYTLEIKELVEKSEGEYFLILGV